MGRGGTPRDFVGIYIMIMIINYKTICGRGPGAVSLYQVRPPKWGSLVDTTDGAGHFVIAKCVIGHNQTEKYDIEGL